MSIVVAWKEMADIMAKLDKPQQYRTLLALAIAYDLPIGATGPAPKAEETLAPGDHQEKR